MNQTLLLGAFDGIIAGIEIGHQNTVELVEHLLSCGSLTSLTINEGNILQAGEHPHVCLLPCNVGSGFIRVYKCAAHNLAENGLVGAFAAFRKLDSYPFNRKQKYFNKPQVKQPQVVG